MLEWESAADARFSWLMLSFSQKRLTCLPNELLHEFEKEKGY